MKKLFLLIAIFVFAIGAANAQNQKAIGLRFGAITTEISYQHPLSDANRLELDLGFGYSNYFNLTGVYQWVWDLSALAPGFNWYAGAGASLTLGSSIFSVAPVGNVGIEYNFDIPLQVSLDWRPGFYIGKGYTGFVYDGISLGVRYKF